MSEELIKKGRNGRWRIAHGRASYTTKEQAERALFGYQAAIGVSLRGQKRTKLTDMNSKEAMKGNNL